MKKLILSIAASALALSAMAEGIITEQPEGTYYDTVSGSTEITYLLYNGTLPALTRSDCGFKTDMVVNGKDVYLHNVIHDYPMGDAWIKGTQGEDGVVVFNFPQTVYVDDATGMEVTINLLHRESSVSGATYVPYEADNTMRMIWDNWTLRQIKPEADNEDEFRIGLANTAGSYMGYAFVGLELSVVDTDPVSLPIDADLTETEYSCSYVDKNGDSKTVLVTLYRDAEGADVWLVGLNENKNKQVVHGEINPQGDIELASGQFMGFTQDYFTYFYGGKGDNKNLSWTEKATLHYDGELLKTDDILIINQGNSRPILGFSLTDMVMTPVDAIVRTPSAPEIPLDNDLGPEPYNDSEGMGLATYNIFATDIDGQALDTDKLFYNLYFDGVLQEFEIDGTVTSDIPYQYSDPDYMIINAEEYNLAIFFEPIKTYSIQTIYRNRDEVTKSALVTYSFETGDVTTDGISDAMADAEVVRIEYYTLQGMAISEPSGLCIIRTVYTDGSSKTTKAYIRK